MILVSIVFLKEILLNDIDSFDNVRRNIEMHKTNTKLKINLKQFLTKFQKKRFNFFKKPNPYIF
jgi:hypothetical protein